MALINQVSFTGTFNKVKLKTTWWTFLFNFTCEILYIHPFYEKKNLTVFEAVDLYVE